MSDAPVAIVTGGSGDIGGAISRRLAADGMSVCVHYRSGRDRAEAVVKTIAEAGGRAYALEADLTDPAEATRLVAAVVERSGRLDVLVNNAGASKDGLFMMMSEADWDFVIDANLKSLYGATRAAIREMISQRSGSIVVVSSLSGTAGLPGQANYAAAKGGAIAFARSLSRELAPFHIRVNTVAPGLIESRMADAIPATHREALIDIIPMKRPGTPEEVADATAFLASDRAGYITGHTLFVTGGLY